MQEKTRKAFDAVEKRVNKGEPLKEAVKAEGRTTQWFYNTRSNMKAADKPKRRKHRKLIVTDIPEVAPSPGLAFMFVGSPQTLLQLSRAMQ